MREAFRQRIAALFNVAPFVAAPKQRAGIYFYLALRPDKDGLALMARPVGGNGEPKVLVDPDTMGVGGRHANIDSFEPSWDGKYVVVGIGSRWLGNGHTPRSGNGDRALAVRSHPACTIRACRLGGGRRRFLLLAVAGTASRRAANGYLREPTRLFPQEFYAITKRGAPNSRVVCLDLGKDTMAGAREVVPASDLVLTTPEDGLVAARDGVYLHGVRDGLGTLIKLPYDSPYEHVKKGVAYPAVLLTTGINDPRMPPWMVAKMAAKLQADTSLGKPILLSVNFDKGHGGNSKAQVVEDLALQYSFLAA